MPAYTKKQKTVMEFIVRFQQEHGLSPTLKEIGEELDITRVTAFQHVRSLERKAALKTTPLLARSIVILDPDFKPEMTDIPIAGKISAGSPIEALEDRQTFDPREFFPADEGYFLLRVRGDSMIGDHIRDGDLVLVEPRESADDGETVVAVLESGDATLKRLYREKRGFRLQPSNPRMDPIFTDTLEIRGVVRGVVRRY